jgi:hypothetical protein
MKKALLLAFSFFVLFWSYAQSYHLSLRLQKGRTYYQVTSARMHILQKLSGQ